MGAPLRDLFAGVGSLPHSGFEQTLLGPPAAPPYTACVLGVDEAPETPFGSAAVATIRAAYPPDLIAEPARPRGTLLDEVDAIEGAATRIRSLRIYGGRTYATLNPTTEGVRLRGSRTFSTTNLAATLLPRCETVELWASTGSLGEARGIMDGDRDVMPRLVRAFLLGGAAGVLDLAWPVPDLVVALVYEQYAHLRVVRAADGDPGAVTLRMALQVVADRLAQWERACVSAPSVRAALEVLDHARREDLRETGRAPSLAIPFASCHHAPKGPAAPFLEYTCRPVHLAAFRWWGP
jgi:hypothetical protein